MPAATKKATAKKAAPAKKATTKKSAPAKAAAPKVSPEEVQKRRDAKAKADAALATKIAKLRDAGKTWDEITTELDVTQGRAAMLLMRHEAGDPAGNPTTAKVVKDRDSAGMSWPAIAAKYGTTKANIQKLYAESGKDPHASYIGQGGRYFSHETKVAKAKGTTTKATSGTAKKAAAKTSAAKSMFTDNTPAADIIDKVTGKTVHYHSPDPAKYPGDSEVKVVSNVKVGKTKSGQRVVAFNDGNKSRTIAVNGIFKITK